MPDQMPGQAPPSPEGGGPGEAVQMAHESLLKLQQMLGDTPAAQKVGALIQGLEAVVAEVEGGGPPQPGDSGPKPMGPVDAMGGPNGVPRQ